MNGAKYWSRVSGKETSSRVLNGIIMILIIISYIFIKCSVKLSRLSRKDNPWEIISFWALSSFWRRACMQLMSCVCLPVVVPLWVSVACSETTRVKVTVWCHLVSSNKEDIKQYSKLMVRDKMHVILNVPFLPVYILEEFYVYIFYSNLSLYKYHIEQKICWTVRLWFTGSYAIEIFVNGTKSHHPTTGQIVIDVSSTIL